MPHALVRYVHRIGRTARAGTFGTSIVLLTEEVYLVYFVQYCLFTNLIIIRKKISFFMYLQKASPQKIKSRNLGRKEKVMILSNFIFLLWEYDIFFLNILCSVVLLSFFQLNSTYLGLFFFTYFYLGCT